MKVDLHCHTKISDNSLGIEDVILLAKQNGVTHLAITDHETTAGLEEAMNIGNNLGVEIIPGIEISGYDYKRNSRAHILGLYVTPGHEAIDKLCRPLIEKRHQACYDMVQKIIAAGYDISWEEVQRFAEGGTGVYKQHIMHALLEKGYTDGVYGGLYKKLFSRGSQSQEPGVAFVPIQYVDAFDAIQTIKKANGIPVLAHPGQFNNFNAVKKWAEAGLEGIEVKHPLHNEQDEAKAAELARQYNLIKTGGSDFHGFYGDSNTSVGSKSIGIEYLEALRERKEKVDLEIRQA